MAKGSILRASASPIAVAAVDSASVPAERHRTRPEDDRQRKIGKDGLRHLRKFARLFHRYT